MQLSNPYCHAPVIAGEREILEDRWILWKFDNEQEFADQIENGKLYPMGGCYESENKHSSHSHATFEDAVRDIRYGWQKAGYQAEHISASLVAKDEMYAHTVALSHDVAGFRPDVPLHLSGEPENMFTFKETKARAPVLSIVSSLGVNCSISKEAIQHRGTAISYWIDLIENSGIRVELTGHVGSAAGWYGKSYIPNGVEFGLEVFLKIKRAQDPLEYNRMATALSMPDLIRRGFFRILEQCNHNLFWDKIGDGYGKPMETPSKFFLKDNPLIIRKMGNSLEYNNIETAIETIRKGLDAYLDINPEYEFRAQR